MNTLFFFTGEIKSFWVSKSGLFRPMIHFIIDGRMTLSQRNIVLHKIRNASLFFVQRKCKYGSNISDLNKLSSGSTRQHTEYHSLNKQAPILHY